MFAVRLSQAFNSFQFLLIIFMQHGLVLRDEWQLQVLRIEINFCVMEVTCFNTVSIVSEITYHSPLPNHYIGNYIGDYIESLLGKR